MNPHSLTYGSWPSPITSETIVAGSLRLGEIRLDSGNPENSAIYWTEGRPEEKGRNALVVWEQERPTQDLLPTEMNVRTRVHEYGGGAYIVWQGKVFFSNDSDRRLYQRLEDGSVRAITAAGRVRFADAVVDGGRDRLICVREDVRHLQELGDDEHGEPRNEIVVVTGVGEEGDSGELDLGNVLVAGDDFYSSPRISPDGEWLAWLSWNHPNMPWDGTELWLARLNSEGEIAQSFKVAGGGAESIFQPEWSPDGVLTFISDRSGWWNLYRWVDGEIEALVSMEADFGLPHWVFRMSTYGYESADSLICTYLADGRRKLARLNLRSRQLAEIEIPYTSAGGIQVGVGQIVFAGASPTDSGAIVRLDSKTGECEVLRLSSQVDVDASYISEPQEIAFSTTGDRTSYGFYYPPKNPQYKGIEGEKPPLLVKSHGGPTAATSSSLDWRIQYWTSRGIAVLDVNYGGSTGFGRDYRDQLLGQWGVVDVDDCCAGAEYLVAQGLVDGDRLAIDGRSAGGYTTLAALTFRDTFKAGASYYGICDLEVLAQDTHKFESRYMDSLVGPYPEMKEVYESRSPINFVDQLSCPIIFLQGDEDKVVPPNQAELMVEALRKKGLPVSLLLFEGEQHGFRQAGSIKRALEAELYFYGQMFGFTLADEIEPVVIDNWPSE